MKRGKKNPALRITPEMAAMAAGPDELVAITEKAAAAAREAAPGYEVVVIVAVPMMTPTPFRVIWGSLVNERASWLIYRALVAIEKLL